MEHIQCTTEEFIHALKAVENEDYNKCEEKAKNYFYNQKKPKKGYNVTGTSIYSADDVDDYDGNYFVFTDEEVAKIKQLMVDTWNGDEKEYKEFEEALYEEDMRLEELYGRNPELDKIFFNRLGNSLKSIGYVDWDNPQYEYNVSVHGYYKENNQYPVCHCLINLTDEEYILLLTNQLYKRVFTFNDLLHSKKTRNLALKIHDKLYGVFDEFLEETALFPFLISLDEVEKDAYEIDGPMRMDETLFDAGNNMENEICARIEKRELLVSRNYNHCDGFASIEDVSADEVMKCLGKDNYEDTLKELKARYNTETAYDDIKRLLTENNIKFKETK